jgi:hypothetical protein
MNKLYDFEPGGSRGIEEIDNGNSRLGINPATLIGGRKKQKITDLYKKKRCIKTHRSKTNRRKTRRSKTRCSKTRCSETRRSKSI